MCDQCDDDDVEAALLEMEQAARDAVSIVRALAEVDPTRCVGGVRGGGKVYECAACGATRALRSPAAVVIEHRPSCPWLRATAWVEHYGTYPDDDLWAEPEPPLGRHLVSIEPNASYL